MPKTKRLIGTDDLYNFELIGETRLSPDGRSAICSVQRVERKTEKKYTNLWLAETGAGPARQFTFGQHSDSKPRWSADGAQIAFLSNRGDKDKPPALYLLPFNGGEARPLVELPGEIGALEWSPDGKYLALALRKLDAEQIERQQDEQKKKLGVVARHYERLFYKLDGYGYLPKERWHLWRVDVRSGKAKQLTEHAVFDEEQPAWSPDGKLLAFVSNRSSDPDGQPDAIDLWVMPAQGGDLRCIETPLGSKSHPAWSPDGRWIAYFGQQGEGDWYRNTSVWIVPADGSGPARNLTAADDIHAAAGVICDTAPAEQMPPTWSSDSARLYFQASLHGKSILMSIDTQGADLRTEIDVEGSLGSFGFDRQQTQLCYTLGTLDDPAQVWSMAWPKGRPRQLTQFNAWLKQVDLGQIEMHWIKGPHGNDLQGWILKPPGYKDGQSYPSILEIHGGPLTQYGYAFMHEFYYLAAQGFVVSFSNPRGGRGYGEEHAGAIWGGWGTVDYDDVMAWADFVARQPYIDPQRMGVGGGSYGGYMTVWIIGHTQRFKAAVAMRCVSNFVSMWGSSDMNWVFQQALQAGAPFEDLDKHWAHSPIAFIGNAKTPTLVMHNEMDHRCPIEQGEQVFVALKRLGVATEMVRFPDEFHGLSRTGRTDRRIARLEHIARWFKQYL